MSTYTEDGDYWHEKWEQSQRELAVLRSRADFLESMYLEKRTEHEELITLRKAFVVHMQRVHEARKDKTLRMNKGAELFTSCRVSDCKEATELLGLTTLERA